MYFKHDFARAAEHVEAFWAHDCIDRPGLQVIARRSDADRIDEGGGGAASEFGINDAGIAVRTRRDDGPSEDVVDVVTRKTDVGHVIDRAERTFRSHHYLAEAVPVYIPGLVCSDTAAYLSDQIGIAEDTIWYPRIIHDWTSFELKFDHDNRWWQLTKRMAAAAAERARGRYLISVPDFQAGIDIVSLLRSPEKLCFDLVEDPDSIKAATSFIMDEVYAHCIAEILSIIGRGSEFVADWMGLFSRGKHDVVQCDFSALISPRHFEEFCLPDIAGQCEMLDQSVFHLDGPGAVRHVDALLEIDSLDAIQWVPGAGNPTAAAWLPMLQKIQAGGKSLYVTAPPEEVETILDGLSPRGLMIGVLGAFESFEEGQHFIESVGRMCARG